LGGTCDTEIQHPPQKPKTTPSDGNKTVSGDFSPLEYDPYPPGDGRLSRLIRLSESNAIVFE